MMLFLSVGDAVLMAIRKAIRTLFLSLCEIIFKLIVFFYNIFERFGTASIMSNAIVIDIYKRVGLILGLVMIFRISFYFIQYVINPDLIGDKNIGVGNIVKRVIVVIVLLGITPFLFREAYSFQSFIVEQNIVGKVISGKNISNYTESTGEELAWYAFSSFYRPIDQSNITSYEGDISCVALSGGAFESDFKLYNNFKYGYNCLNDTVDVIYNGHTENTEDFIIDFDGNGLVPALVGLLILWLIVMYTVQLGVRLLQLAYLQLIAPIPIMLHLNPKSDALQKWGKQCLTTFVDYFIRSAIMYFAVFIIRIILDAYDSSTFMSSFDDLNLGTFGEYYIRLIIIIAMLIFAKRVPKLLEDIFPVLKNAASLDFGLKMPKEMKQVGGVVGGAGLGVVGAGVSGISRYKSNRANGKSVRESMLGGAYGVGAGLVKGVKSGFTKNGVSGGWKNIQESNNKYNKLITSGGSTLGTIRAKVGDTFGESKGQEFTRLMANYQKVIDDNKYVNDIAEEFSEVKKLKTRWETLRMSGTAGEDDINAAFDTYKSAKKAALNAALNGSNTFTYAVTSVRNVGGIPMISVDPNGGSGDFSKFEDSTFAAQIEVRKNDTEDFINSHNVKLMDSSGNPITRFNSADVFKDASVRASREQTDILKNNDFGASIANDAAAGIDSHKTARKDK